MSFDISEIRSVLIVKKDTIHQENFALFLQRFERDRRVGTAVLCCIDMRYYCDCAGIIIRRSFINSQTSFFLFSDSYSVG